MLALNSYPPGMSLASPPIEVVAEPAPQASWPSRAWRVGPWFVGRLFGFLALVVGLAVTATLPGLQPLVLGYLLEVSGRVGRSGRLRDGFLGLDEAARLGVIVVATIVCFVPAWFLSSLATDALIIDPMGPAARRATIAFYVVTVVALWHVGGALLRGGRLRNFLWPRPIDTARRLFSPGMFNTARDAIWRVVDEMQLPHLYGLGLRAAIATVLWLGVPVSCMFFGRERPPLAIVGGVLTALGMLYVPWLQTQFVVDDGAWRKLFAVGDVRRRFHRAPWAFAAALVFLLATALPLYLLKIELVPREAAWLPGIVFVLFAFPARLALSRAYAFAERRTAPRGRLTVLSAAAVCCLASVAYVVVTYLSQTTSWYGRYSLFEQHVVLFPVPFWHWR